MRKPSVTQYSHLTGEYTDLGSDRDLPRSQHPTDPVLKWSQHHVAQVQHSCPHS